MFKASHNYVQLQLSSSHCTAFVPSTLQGDESTTSLSAACTLLSAGSLSRRCYDQATLPPPCIMHPQHQAHFFPAAHCSARSSFKFKERFPILHSMHRVIASQSRLQAVLGSLLPQSQSLHDPKALSHRNCLHTLDAGCLSQQTCRCSMLRW